jgi:hypothetical protein
MYFSYYMSFILFYLFLFLHFYRITISLKRKDKSGFCPAFRSSIMQILFAMNESRSHAFLKYLKFRERALRGFWA